MFILSTFQFQTGAIKRKIILPDTQRVDEFQFQTGAIKRDALSTADSRFLLDFNSKLVRLKVAQLAAATGVILKFQFQTGAIKRNRDGYPISSGLLFQFQTGAIKRNLQQADLFGDNFNSKLVRLKAADRCYVLRLPWLFQFQTGAIKSCLQVLPFRKRDRFQFQTGAIKSDTCCQNQQEAALFQFQTGAIKSPR